MTEALRFTLEWAGCAADWIDNGSDAGEALIALN
jgi:hypothetical protein